VLGTYALLKPGTVPSSTAASVAMAPAPAAPAASSTTPAPGGYTAAQVAAHDSAQSCWTSISGNVYDLTAWIDQHPGGQAPILSLCGTDGTAAFMQQHGGQGRPEQELATFKIGALAS
jgi:cytochrome b involved in lipid metabolism